MWAFALMRRQPWWRRAIVALVALTFAGCSEVNQPSAGTPVLKKQTDPIADWITTAVKGERVRIHGLDSPSAGTYVLTLTGNTESTVYSAEDKLRSDTARIIGRIFGYATDNETPAQLTLIWMLPGADGAMHSVMKVEISRGTAKQKIWKRVYPSRLPDAVDKYDYSRSGDQG